MRFVVGIFANHDAVSNPVYALKSARFDASYLTVISNDGPLGYLRQAEATFVRRAPQPYAGAEPLRMHVLKEVAFDIPGDAIGAAV